MVAGLIGIVLVFVLILLGLPTAFAMLLVAFAGLASLRGIDQALSTVGSAAYHMVANWMYLVIPMFLLMGEFASVSGVVAEIFSSFRIWFGRIRGSLGIVTILTAVLLSFASGSSLAATAVLGRIALPEMTKAGYDRKLSLSSVLAGGTLDNMIPPSIGLPLYAILTDQSIGKMLIAGIFPGLLVAGMFIAWMVWEVKRKPYLTPNTPPTTWREKVRSLSKTWQLLVLIVVVMGGMYFGIFTVTEAATIGAFGAFLMAIASRRLTLARALECLETTVVMSAMIFFLLFAVGLFTRFLTFSGFSREILTWAVAFQTSPWLFLTILSVIYLVLGCIMDATCKMLLIVPLAYPVAVALGFDPVWFGVFTVAMVQIGQLTPPAGMCVNVLKSVSGDSFGQCFMAALPVLVVWLVGTFLLALWPQIALWLPSKM